MKIEFDPAKDIVNFAKHGLSLSLAADIDFSGSLIKPDHRFSYGEERFQALGPIKDRLHVVIFTMRGETFRVISLRKANMRERKYYAEATGKAAPYRPKGVG